MQKKPNAIIAIFLLWPEKIASHISCFGPLIARLVVGEVFMISGWGKLKNLAYMTETFADWGIPFPELLTPFVAGAEFIGGIFLILGLFTRIFSGILAVIMLVAIHNVLWANVDSLDTLLGFSETAYFAIFTWLAIAGAGKLSIDYWLTKKCTL